MELGPSSPVTATPPNSGLRPCPGCGEALASAGPAPVGGVWLCPQCPQPLLCALSTVLLLNPVEVQAEFLAVANKLSTPGHTPHSAYITLLLHAFQATFGTNCDLPGLHHRLQVCVWCPGATHHPLPAEHSFREARSPVCFISVLPSPVHTGLPHPKGHGRAVDGELAWSRGFCCAGSGPGWLAPWAVGLGTEPQRNEI